MDFELICQVLPPSSVLELKLIRKAHGQNKCDMEWARDDDGDGYREVHINSNEGGWTGLRNFLRPFRGVHKQYLAGYVAIHEFAVNHKVVSPQFVSAIVRSHLS